MKTAYRALVWVDRDPRLGICAICHGDHILDEHGCCIELEECLSR